MIIAGSRSLLVAGLEPGRFTELPGGGGVVYVGAMSNDGTAADPRSSSTAKRAAAST